MKEHQVQNNYFSQTKLKVEQAKQYCAGALESIRKQSDKIKNIYCKSKIIEEKLVAYEKELDKFLHDSEKTELFVHKFSVKKKK